MTMKFSKAANRRLNLAAVPRESGQVDRLLDNSRQMMRLDLIDANPRDPRQHEDDESLQELAASIAEHGLLQAPVVRRHPENPDRYMVVLGTRRINAHRLLGRDAVEVIVRRLDDQQAFLASCVDNVQRMALSPREEMDMLGGLIDELGSQEAVARALGKNPTWVTQREHALSVPALPDEERQSTDERQEGDGKEGGDQRAPLGNTETETPSPDGEHGGQVDGQQPSNLLPLGQAFQQKLAQAMRRQVDQVLQQAHEETRQHVEQMLVEHTPQEVQQQSWQAPEQAEHRGDQDEGEQQVGEDRQDPKALDAGAGEDQEQSQSPLQAIGQAMAMVVKRTIQWLAKMLEALLETVRLLLRKVTLLVQSVAESLKEGLLLLVHPLAEIARFVWSRVMVWIRPLLTRA